MNSDPLIVAGTIIAGIAGGVIARAIVIRWTHRPNIALGIGVVLGLAAMTVAYLLVSSPFTTNRALHEQLTSEAWKAFDEKNYESAIQHALSCIDRYESDADVLQQDVRNKGGLSPTEPKEVTFARGPLNDVATSWFIAGRSHEALGQTAEARNAYGACEEYTFAQTYDPNGSFFWSPSRICTSRLKKLL